MFSSKTYSERRKKLTELTGSGIILLLGNEESPMNYLDNAYSFRQDSTFLYYFGIDQPGLTGIIDIDEKKEIIFGNELTVEEIVWMGVQKTIAEKALLAGVQETKPLEELPRLLAEAIHKGRKIHFIPQYRAENILELSQLLGLNSLRINEYASPVLMKAVIEQRSVKSDEEIKQIESALLVSYQMYKAAYKVTRPGILEKDISGMMEGIALAIGNGLSFPTIFSMFGEILHNHYHGNIMEEGRLIVCDSGSESELHYASDITRTFPVSGKFTDIQKTVYQIVLNANLAGIAAVKPGLKFREVHLLASKTIAEGLKDLGLLKGNIEDIVSSGAHALFFVHGIGHMLGLDVHDMENFGEVNTGYSDTIQRSQQFGLNALRYGKELRTGNVMTIEPGIYFIPQLIEKWESENILTDFINYDKVKEYIGFGGIRVEDDVLVTETGSRVLGKPIPKTIEDIENAMAAK